MLGGGNFTVQNKVLPGAYINFVSVASPSVGISDRGNIGYAAALGWGDTVTVIDGSKIKDIKKLLGYAVDDEHIKDIRDILLHGTTLYLYRLDGAGVKASNDYATAKYAGTRGNAIKIAIANSLDVSGSYVVTTYLDAVAVDKQVVATAADLKENDFVTFKTDASLTVEAGASLTGGTDSDVNGEAYTAAYAEFEKYPLNAVAITSTTEAIVKVFAAWVIRMREEVGFKVQGVCKYAADHEGIVNVDDVKAIPWVVGAIGGCAVNASCTNMLFDGENEIKSDYTQSELSAAIKAGKLVFHTVGDEVRLLSDINSLVSLTPEKNESFQMNQVIRVLDTTATSVASIFCDTYLGKVLNNSDGRTSLKSQLVKMCEELQNIGAIENFNSEDITVEAGNLKKSVVVNMAITPVVAMEQLYCTVSVN